MLDINQRFIPGLDRNLRAFLGGREGQGMTTQVNAFMDWFRRQYGGRVLQNTDELTLFLADIGQPANVPAGTPPVLLDRLRHVKARMWQHLGDFDAINQALANLAAADVVDPRTERRMRRLDADEQEAVINDLARQYLGMMGVVSPEALATALETLGELSHEDRVAFIGRLGKLLNGGIGGGGGGGGPPVFLNYDPELLSLPGIREYVIRRLIVVVYRALQERADDINQRPDLFADIETQAERTLRALAREARVPDPSVHDPLFADVTAFFKNVAHLATVEIPALDRFVTSLRDYQGVERPFPSLRQLVAVQAARQPDADEEDGEKRVQKQYVFFRPRDGKTPIDYIKWELECARCRQAGETEPRLFHILPSHTLWDIANQVREQPSGHAHQRFYREGMAPQTGVIHSSIQGRQRQQRFDEALRQPVIYCSISMMSSMHRRRQIRDHLLGITPRFVIVDEAQDISNGGGVMAKDVRRLFLGAGSRTQYSGTPHGVDGLRGTANALELLEDPDAAHPGIDRFLNTNTKYKTASVESVARLRGRFGRLLALDEPRNYASMWTFDPVAVAPNDAYERIVQRTVNDMSLSFWSKYNTILLAGRATWLLHPNAQSPILNRIQDLIAQHLHELRVIVVLEEKLRRGVFEQHPDYPGDSMRNRLQAFVEALGGEYAHIYGSIGDARRQGIYEQMRTARTDGAKPLVVHAQAKCMRTGIDARSAGLFLRSGSSFRLSDIEQESCRGGPNMVPMFIIFPGNQPGGMDSMEQTKLDIALAHSAIEMRTLHGDSVSAQRLREVQQTEQEMVRRGDIRGGLESNEQKALRFERNLHGAGANGVRRFWQEQQHDWRRMYLEEANRSGFHAANVQRLTHALIKKLEEDGVIGDGPIVQVSTHGLSLARQRGADPQSSVREMISVEPKRFMLDEPLNNVPNTLSLARHEGSALSLLRLHQGGSIPPDGAACMVLDDLQHYGWDASHPGGITFQERATALLNACRTSKILVLPIPVDACTDAQFNDFCTQTLPKFGRQVLTTYTGTAESADNRGEQPWQCRIVVAEPASDRMPGRAAVLSQLTTSDLAFQHVSERGLPARRAARNRFLQRRLPYPLVQNQFSIGSVELEGGQEPPRRQEQLDHLTALEEAVRHIRSLAGSRDAWRRLDDRIRRNLDQQRGIVWTGSVQRPGFYLHDYPEYTFYPYDQAWDGI